ncbi:D-alanyl-D-alanine carboxypeptidase family protein [Streptacidiphilus fuscans]|uniref:D-alanyl-D-alanine carboxypeptidase n=1 Tax=Streptacidiphilus fuscans TaxID=2789292 RepID=A0A931FF22_9ACTN|nr:D-alanyl-D-alanine carboxypeptidase [Streptacidiphilus fuscans]MBF9068014.1 D-alanyl-D-alanine carboxypeptidase [Streptacidiphilus fuscans]
MGESPDRSQRTAGAEREPERAGNDPAVPAPDVEPAPEIEEATESSVDMPTRVLRTLDADPEKPEAESTEPEADTETEADTEAEPEAEASEAEEAPEDPEAPEAETDAAEEEAPEAEAEAEADEEAQPEAVEESAEEPTDSVEADEPTADEPVAEDTDEPTADAPADEAPAAEPAAEAPAADEPDDEDETRAMPVFPPPLPPTPPGGSRGPGGAGGGSGAPSPEAVPAGAGAMGTATAVMPSPETTAEAMDILATLSSRPMTPARIALRRIRLWGTLLLALVIVLGTAQLLRPIPTPTLQYTGEQSFTFSGGTPNLQWPTAGQAAVAVPGLGVLGHSGSDNQVPLASVTKVMTAYIVLRDHPLKVGDQGPMVPVDQAAVNDYNTGKPQGESVMKVSVGEPLTEYQALQLLLIPSANNVARLLGRWDAGSDAAFVQKMQSTAAGLGMTKTVYTDPSGLDATTKSTANDQLKLIEAAMQMPVFKEVVSTPSFNAAENGVTPNTNTLVGSNGVVGIKTGTSTAALGNLVWAAEQNVGGSQQLILGAVLSQPATGTGPGQGILAQVLQKSQQLIVSAEGALQSHTVIKKGDVVGYVDDGLGGHTPVVATADVNVIGWSGLSVTMSLQPLTGQSVPHTATAGTTVGNLVVGSGAGAQTIPVALQSALSTPSVGAKLTRLT